MRLLGVRHIVAFAVAAVVGDIARFANPKKLVAYLGLTPSVEDSGETIRGRGQLVSFGRSDLRALLVCSYYIKPTSAPNPRSNVLGRGSVAAALCQTAALFGNAHERTGPTAGRGARRRVARWRVSLRQIQSCNSASRRWRSVISGGSPSAAVMMRA
jgi:hypothetical protein